MTRGSGGSSEMRRASPFIVTAAMVLFSGTLFAQQLDKSDREPGDIPSWVKSTGVLTGMSGGPLLSIWLVWYFCVKRLPRDAREHREAMDRMEARHAAHVSELNANFRADLKELWTTRSKDTEKLEEAIDKLTMVVQQLIMQQQQHHGQRGRASG